MTDLFTAIVVTALKEKGTVAIVRAGGSGLD